MFLQTGVRGLTEPDVRLHVGQLAGQDVPDHLYRHPIARHLLPHPESPAGRSERLRATAATADEFLTSKITYSTITELNLKHTQKQVTERKCFI